MSYDHFISAVDCTVNPFLDRMQHASLQSLACAKKTYSGTAQINCFCSSPEYYYIDPPKEIKNTQPYINYKTIWQPATELFLPTIKEVLHTIKSNGAADWVILANPTVLTAPDLYVYLDYFISTGHDGVLFASGIKNISSVTQLNCKNLRMQTMTPNSYSYHADAIMFKRSCLDDLEEISSFATIPYALESIFLLLLSKNRHVKYFYEGTLFNRVNQSSVYNFSMYAEEIEQNRLVCRNILDTKAAKETRHSSRVDFLVTHKILSPSW